MRSVSVYILTVIALASSTAAHAAVIYSTCPVPPTAPSSPQASQTESVDRFRPSEFQLKLRRYSDDIRKSLYYLAWAMSSERYLGFDPEPHEAAAQKTGRWIEDLQFFITLADEDQPCHGENKPLSEAKAIFPVVLRGTGADGQLQNRVRFRLCEYYVDQQRQIPFENECRVIGRESGYTMDDLDRRFNEFKTNVESTREYLNTSTYAASALLGLTAFRSLRILGVGSLPSLGAALVPPGSAYVLVKEGLTDVLIRDAVEMRDAASIAVHGDLTTSIPITRPIQDFVPYFARYLESVHPEAVKSVSNF